jgi:hypothetical protein
MYMRITKATVVATGALAAFAVTSAAPAFAAAADTSSDTNTTVMTPIYEGQHRTGVEGDYNHDDGIGGFPGFWQPQALTSTLNGTSATTGAVQTAGSANTTGVGAAAPIDSPSTVVGDANNANTVISYFD